ncbi:MAG: gltX [Ilumatobacteraceae bacterium]|nr:gltX [Ilumatobacteraceae bacterium]
MVRAMDAPRYRFAPSPTGFFHVGGARTALYNWALARQQGGTFVLRVEDTDEARNRPEWTDGIIEALAWIGISKDDPTFEGPYFQSHYAQQHIAAAERLFQSGHAYYCDLTGDQIQERSKVSGKPGYDGYSRDRGLGPAPGNVLRFRVPTGSTVVHDAVRGEVTFENDSIEDFVLLRGNGSPMFLLANVVDDMTMRISHVLRAEEHLPNTPKQQMLWQALGAQPPVWAHVPVLVNEQRKKLSKRRDKVALESYRDEGYLADAMVNYLMTLGWAPKGDTEIVPWSTIEADFRLDDVTHSPAFFDVKKLTSFNGDYIRAMPVDEFTAACEPWIQQWCQVHPNVEWQPTIWQTMAPFVQTRIGVLAEAPGYIDFLLLPEPEFDEGSIAKAVKAPGARDVLAEVIAAYESVDWNRDAMKDTFDAIAEAREMKPGKAGGPMRVAITGRSVGPPMYESLELLGRDETLRRMRSFLDGPLAP